MRGRNSCVHAQSVSHPVVTAVHAMEAADLEGEQHAVLVAVDHEREQVRDVRERDGLVDDHCADGARVHELAQARPPVSIHSCHGQSTRRIAVARHLGGPRAIASRLAQLHAQRWQHEQRLCPRPPRQTNSMTVATSSSAHLRRQLGRRRARWPPAPRRAQRQRPPPSSVHFATTPAPQRAPAPSRLS
jgi:hypothetical protein